MKTQMHHFKDGEIVIRQRFAFKPIELNDRCSQDLNTMVWLENYWSVEYVRSIDKEWEPKFGKIAAFSRIFDAFEYVNKMEFSHMNPQWKEKARCIAYCPSSGSTVFEMVKVTEDEPSVSPLPVYSKNKSLDVIGWHPNTKSDNEIRNPKPLDYKLIPIDPNLDSAIRG
jgi:hypothetical protein